MVRERLRREFAKARASPRFLALMDRIPSVRARPTSSLDIESEPCWRIPAGQHFVFADFEDGIVMFDALVGATHLLNGSAAETLAIVQASPGLTTAAIHRCLLERLQIEADVLPFAALAELVWQLENLNLIAAFAE